MADVRKFEFPPKTQLQQKERTRAVAWATDKVGGWRGANVTAAIQRYLQEAGYKVDQQHIKYSMDYLVANDLAIAVIRGKRTVEFIMAPDVELDEPDFVRAQRVRAASHGPDVNGQSPTAAVVTAPEWPERGPKVLPARERMVPRLPSAVRGPQRLDELGAALRSWHRHDSEACDLWIASVLEDLQTN